MATSYSHDRWMSLSELAEKCGGKSPKTLRKVAQSQAGMYLDNPLLSRACISSYPPMQRGPGNRWGCWLSTFEAWRETRDAALYGE